MAFYIRCSDNRSRDGGIEVTLYFTAITRPDDCIMTFEVGLQFQLKLYVKSLNWMKVIKSG
ncbi:MAG: hypothetical protein K2N51_08485 [Lachnospiraceae bacterium]|nr:hypothetical protein [Lachnospiraceae bacterium]